MCSPCSADGDQLVEPFSHEHEELVSLSSAAQAPPEVAKDLLEAYIIGEDAYKTFKQECLQEDAPSTQFHDRMTKKKMKTFSDIRKKPRNQGHAKEVVLKADRKLFGQMVLIAESRELQMRDVLAHPLGPLGPMVMGHSARPTKQPWQRSWRRMFLQLKRYQSHQQLSLMG